MRVCEQIADFLIILSFNLICVYFLRLVHGQGRPPQALSDCKSSLIAGISMMAAITRLIIGSMMCSPVPDITRPEMRTPTETSVSDTICRKEALMLISRS